MMYRLFLSLLFVATCGSAFAGDCDFGQGHYGPGTLMCQVGQVRMCNANGSWGDPNGGIRRCPSLATKTIRIMSARAELYVPGDATHIKEKEDVGSQFSSHCDGLPECPLTPKEVFSRNGYTYNLYIQYACYNEAGKEVKRKPEEEHQANTFTRFQCETRRPKH